MNWWLADPDHFGGPWRLQELPDTELKIGFRDMPRFGRRYGVFYNQVRLGRIEVSSVYGSEVRAEIELDYVRLLSFEHVSGFLHDIALHICSDRDSKGRVAAGIRATLTRMLWDALRISQPSSQDYGEIEQLQLNGPATFYLERRQRLRKYQTAK